MPTGIPSADGITNEVTLPPLIQRWGFHSVQYHHRGLGHGHVDLDKDIILVKQRRFGGSQYSDRCLTLASLMRAWDRMCPVGE